MRLRTSPLAGTVALTFLIVVLLACSGGAPSVAPPGITDFKMTSKEFVKETDGPNASKYSSKTVEVTGKVVSIGINKDSGKANISLEGPTPGPESRWCGCEMVERFPWTQAQPGMTVTIKGRVHQVFPSIYNGELLSAEGAQAPRLTADEFARRTASLPPRAERPRYLIVSGELARKDEINSGWRLKVSPGLTEPILHFNPDEYKAQKIGELKPGTRIEVIGGDSSNPNAAGWLVGCLLMADPQ